MADEKLQPDNIGTIEPRNISDEMAESYLDYAMSVIVARALPDIRDGLKPVHRRVLYAMNRMGLTSRSKHTKSANIVGEVLGKFHPHGDQAAYDTLARLAQDFSLRYPLVDGQGNFGSMDGDRPAAMRYTEARMEALAEALLADIEKETVDFVDNYDGRLQEPKFLPARFPYLLTNGALGIAVGMATNIPPHNLGELVGGTIALIDNPDLELSQLMEFIKGPDFPTGGLIYNIEDIKTAYATGKGKIVMRARAEIQEDKKNHRIVISEIPYQVNKAQLVSKIATLVKDKKIDGISDIRDESDRKEKVRIVVELKHTAYPKKVLNRLFELTPMQTAFHVNMLALEDGIQPRVFTLKDALLAFIDHRILVIRRRTEYELKRAENRAHVLEGLKIALDQIDAVIDTIRSSETREIADQELQKKFKLTEIQSNAILEMRLSALAGLERKKVLDELEEKKKLIEKLKSILGSEKKIRAIITKELEEVREQFGDERRTEVIPTPLGDFSAEDLIPNEHVVITLTDENYIKRVPVSAYRSQKRGGKGIVGMSTKEEDAVSILRVAYTHDDVLFFTSKGRLFKSKVYEIPSASRQAKGTPIVNLIQLGPDEVVTEVITNNHKKKNDKKYFFMGTIKGVVKKTTIESYKNVRQTGIIAIKLKEDDELRWVRMSSGDDSVIMVSAHGQSIHFNETDVRPMGRSASGVRGMKLRATDSVIAMEIIDSQSELLLVTERGFGKRVKLSLFGLQKRGGLGLRALKVTKNRTGEVTAARLVTGDDGEAVIVSSKGQTIRIPVKSFKRLGRDTQGVTVMRFRASGDSIASVAVFSPSDDEVEAATSATTS